MQDRTANERSIRSVMNRKRARERERGKKRRWYQDREGEKIVFGGEDDEGRRRERGAQRKRTLSLFLFPPERKYKGETVSQFTNPDFRSRTSIRVFTLTASISFPLHFLCWEIEGRKGHLVFRPSLLTADDSRLLRSSFGKLYLREFRDRNVSRSIYRYSPSAFSSNWMLTEFFGKIARRLAIRDG